MSNANADAQDSNRSQSLALDDGVGALGGAQHGLADLAAVHLRLLQQLPHRAHDAVKDVGGGGVFDFGDNVEVAVDEDGVGIGAAYVDADVNHWSFLAFFLLRAHGALHMAVRQLLRGVVAHLLLPEVARGPSGRRPPARPPVLRG